MKKMLFAAAAMIAAMTVNAQVALDKTMLTAATLSTNFAVNGDNLDYTGATPVVEGTAQVNSNLTLWYKGNSGDKAGMFKGGDNYIRTNGKDCGLKFKVSANEQVSVVVRAKGSTAPVFAVETGSVVTMPTITATKDNDPDGKSYDEFTIVAKADASGDLFLHETAGGFDVKSYTIGAATAANDAEADAEFAYSVKINGQKVNAKVYNEPVIGLATTVQLGLLSTRSNSSKE